MVIDIKLIIGASFHKVNQLIGEAERTEVVNPSRTPDEKISFKASYQKGTLEVVFIDDIADWVTINNLNSYPFDKSILMEIGLDSQEPDVKLPNVMRWHKITPFDEIAVFHDNHGSIDFIQIKALTN